MAFGSTRQDKKEVGTQSFDPIYLDTKEGKRTIRIVGNEVSFKEYWFENVKVKSGETFKMDRRPVICAVLDEEGNWVGADGENWYTNPYQNWLLEQPEDVQKRLYAKTRFVVNVYDRTPVIITDSKVFYPNMANGYGLPEDVVKSNPPTSHNKIMLLAGSSGKRGGKHLLEQIVNMEDVLMDDEGEPTTVYNRDIIMVTRGTGIDTKRSFIPGMNTKPLTHKDTDVYDLVSFIKPWPYEAMIALQSGEEYDEVREQFKLPKFPKKFGVSVDSDEDLPF